MHGLPFTVNSNHAAYAGANFRMWNIKFDMHPQGNVVVNTTQLNFTEINGTSGTASDLTNADFANNSGFQVEVFYRVA